MNDTKLNENWIEIKRKLKKQYAIITDNDLLFANGNKDEMLEKLQLKLGKSKAELEKIISSL